MAAEWIPQKTDDGSFTFYSEEFGETFHSTRGAQAEAFEKFAVATDLADRAKGDRLSLLDVCYGLGYNTAAALETIWRINPTCQVQVYGLELDATVPKAAVQPPLIDRWTPPLQSILKALAETHQYQSPTLTAQVLIGDARHTIQILTEQAFQAAAILFDPFSPRRCPPLWTVEFFRQVARCLAPDGKLATYSRSASVRAALVEAGLAIGSIPLNPDRALPHEWSQGTVAAFAGTSLPPLSPMEQEHLRTRAAIPYRDRTLQDNAQTILQRHAEEQATCGLESTSSWRRRWHIR